MWSPPEPQAHRSAFQATLGRLVPAKWGREAGCPQAWVGLAGCWVSRFSAQDPGHSSSRLSKGLPWVSSCVQAGAGTLSVADGGWTGCWASGGGDLERKGPLAVCSV